MENILVWCFYSHMSTPTFRQPLLVRRRFDHQNCLNTHTLSKPVKMKLRWIKVVDLYFYLLKKVRELKYSTNPIFTKFFISQINFVENLWTKNCVDRNQVNIRLYNTNQNHHGEKRKQLEHFQLHFWKTFSYLYSVVSLFLWKNQ